jgi:hypothetical protein
MIRKAKGGDVQVSLEIAEAIGFEVQMDEPPTVGATVGAKPGTGEDYSAFAVDGKGGCVDESVDESVEVTPGGGEEYEPEGDDGFM